MRIYKVIAATVILAFSHSSMSDAPDDEMPGKPLTRNNIHESHEMVRASSEYIQKPGTDADPCSDIDSTKDIREKTKCLDKQIAALTEELNRKHALRAKRIGILNSNTKEPAAAGYLLAWNRKTQAIGNLQYPMEARHNMMRGNLVLSAKIRADGTLISTRILRSSGYPLLDKAAIDAVKTAAPFATFSKEMRQQYDMVEIIETFRFGQKNI